MIRRYQEHDADQLLAAWEAASRVAHDFLDEAFFEAERERIRNVYLPSAETWVWEENGRVIGFVSLLGHEVGGLFVDPGAQRRGVGRALMDHARGLRGTLELDVFQRNAIGRAFYASYGFREIGRQAHAETGEAELRLRLEAGEGNARGG
jgi:putative acetyltransferase